MAFKQKSGSPFQRNFGIGKSPAKQTSPMKGDKKMVDGVEVHPDGHEGHHRVGKAANQKWGKTIQASGSKEKAPLEMKSSPIKHPTDAWGFKHGHKYHRSVTGQGDPAPGHEKKAPTTMKSPMKDTKVDQIDKESDAVHKSRTKHDPETNEHVFPMKKSGFKMKSGSPMKRNFGIGDTPSPMKKFGVYETDIDELTGKKTTKQVSRDKVKDITSKRDEIATKIKEIEASYTEDGELDIDAMQATDEWKNLEKQRTDIVAASKKITTTGKDVALEVSQGDTDTFNKAMSDLVEKKGEEWVKEKYNFDSVKPLTKEQYATKIGGGQFGRAATEEGKIVKGMIEELQKDKSGKTSVMEGQPGDQRFFTPHKETQLIDENIMSTGVQEGAELARTQGDKRSQWKSTVSSKIMDAIQDKIDAGEELTPDEKVMQETYISGLGSGITTGEWETLQPGGSYNVSGYGFDEEGKSVDSEGGYGGVVTTSEVDEFGNLKHVPATTENVNLYKHPDSGEMVTMEELPLAEQGKLIASQKKEETYIDKEKQTN